MRVLSTVCVLLVLVAGVSAQEPTTDQKRITALEAQLKKLQTPEPSAALKAAQAQLSKDLQALRDQVAPGCKAIGGKWTITLDAKGQVTSVTCAQR